MTPLAEQLRQAIEKSGKTRYRISLESGISQAVLSRFVNRQREVSLTNADALCEALGLRIMLIPKKKAERRSRREVSKSGNVAEA